MKNLPEKQIMLNWLLPHYVHYLPNYALFFYKYCKPDNYVNIFLVGEKLTITGQINIDELQFPYAVSIRMTKDVPFKDMELHQGIKIEDKITPKTLGKLTEMQELSITEENLRSSLKLFFTLKDEEC